MVTCTVMQHCHGDMQGHAKLLASFTGHSHLQYLQYANMEGWSPGRSGYVQWHQVDRW